MLEAVDDARPQVERWLHVDIEPPLNHLTAAHPLLAETVGYYYGLLHFIVTPLILAWLYRRRPAAFGRLRSALVMATTAANVVFWTWPVAPPRFSVPGLTDILVRYHILGAGNPHGPDSLVNLYAAMPSLHVAWATWCAVAIVTATRTRWRHLAWLYPAATTVVVLASANHFVLDAVGGLAVIALGLLATRPTTRPECATREPGPDVAIPAGCDPARQAEPVTSLRALRPVTQRTPGVPRVHQAGKAGQANTPGVLTDQPRSAWRELPQPGGAICPISVPEPSCVRGCGRRMRRDGRAHPSSVAASSDRSDLVTAWDESRVSSAITTRRAHCSA